VAADRLPEELIRRIREDAEFRRLLLEVLLGEEFLQLPAGLRRIEQAVDRLIEAMERDRQAAREREARIDAQIERLGQRIDDVARSIDRLADRVEAQIEALTKRMERVEAQIEALTARMDRVEAQIEALTQRMERVEAQIEALTARMERVEAQIEALTQRMERVEAQIEALTQRMERVEAQIEALTKRMERVEDRLGSVEERVGSLEERVGSVEDELVRVRNRLDDLTGKALEQCYRERAPAIFGRRLRRVRAMAIGQLAELITERLPGPEGDDLFEADLVVSGRLSTAEQPEVWVIIEVSATVDRFDVERAVRRATALRQLHPLVLPGVAGVRLTEGGRELASEAGVIVITDGKVTGWEAAQARWLPSDETMDDALG
jgi:archaellum component FlaC